MVKEFKFSRRSKENMVGIDPRLVQIANRAIQISSVDFGVPSTGGLRTADTQYSLFLDGKSRADGNFKKSKHQAAKDGYGKALDFYAYVDGRANYEPVFLALVACSLFQASSELGYKITWGGFFKPYKTTKGVSHGWDMSHIQIEN